MFRERKKNPPPYSNVYESFFFNKSSFFPTIFPLNWNKWNRKKYAEIHSLCPRVNPFRRKVTPRGGMLVFYFFVRQKKTGPSNPARKNSSRMHKWWDACLTGWGRHDRRKSARASRASRRRRRCSSSTACRDSDAINVWGSIWYLGILLSWNNGIWWNSIKFMCFESKSTILPCKHNNNLQIVLKSYED